MSNPVNAEVVLAKLIASTQASLVVADPNNQLPFFNPLHKGIKLVVDITGLTGTTPSLTVTIRGRDPVSGKAYTILASAALTANGTTILTVYPGIPATANVSANDVLPAHWDLLLTLGGTGGPTVTCTIAASKLA